LADNQVKLLEKKIDNIIENIKTEKAEDEAERKKNADHEDRWITIDAAESREIQKEIGDDISAFQHKTQQEIWGQKPAQYHIFPAKLLTSLGVRDQFPHFDALEPGVSLHFLYYRGRSTAFLHVRIAHMSAAPLDEPVDQKSLTEGWKTYLQEHAACLWGGPDALKGMNYPKYGNEETERWAYSTFPGDCIHYGIGEKGRIVIFWYVIDKAIINYTPDYGLQWNPWTCALEAFGYASVKAALICFLWAVGIEENATVEESNTPAAERTAITPWNHIHGARNRTLDEASAVYKDHALVLLKTIKTMRTLAKLTLKNSALGLK